MQVSIKLMPGLNRRDGRSGPGWRSQEGRKAQDQEEEASAMMRNGVKRQRQDRLTSSGSRLKEYAEDLPCSVALMSSGRL
jgi:hypothetical protein